MHAPRPGSLVTFALWTTGTAALILAAAAPASLHATDAPAPPPRVNMPTLKTAAGTTLSIVLENGEPTATPGLYRLSPGQFPRLSLAARNDARGNRSATGRYTVRLLSAANRSALSRTPSISRPVWSHSEEIVLNSDQRQTVPIEIDQQPAAGATYTVELSDSDHQSIRPLSFVVAAAASPTTAPTN